MINLHPGEGPRLALHLSPHDGDLTVRCAGAHGQPLEAPLSLPPLDDVLRRAGQPTFHQPVGRDLFRALFPGALGDCYRDAFAAATVAGQTLTLELHFPSEAPHTASYPWELLHDGTRFLLQAGTVTLLRCVPARALPQPTTPRAPLEWLVLTARPADRAPTRDDLDTLNRALAPAQAADRVDLAALVPPTWDALREWTLAGAPDALHVAGHTESGALVLEDAHRQSDQVSADHWGALLSGSRLRLVVLSGIPDAPASDQPPLALALIQAGIPAVVALPRAMPDDGAVRFLTALAAAVVEGAALETAFTQARATLARTTAWHLPTLTRRATLPAPQASALPRRVDTVAPRHASVNQPFRVGLWLLPPDAPTPAREAVERLLGYALSGDPDAAPEAVPAAFVQAERVGAGLVQVEVTAADCAIHGDHGWTLAAWDDQPTPPLWFALTPRRAGPLDIGITLRQGGEPVATVMHPVQVVAGLASASPDAAAGVLRSHTLIRPAQPVPLPEPEPVPAPAPEPVPQTESPPAPRATAPPAPPFDVLDLLREADLLTASQPDPDPGRSVSSARDTGEHAAIQRDLAELQAALDAEDQAEENALDALIRLRVEHTALRTTEVPVQFAPDRRVRALLLAALVLGALVIGALALILLVVR